jgi:phosphoglycerate dehydrogenase-like enzyme
MLGEEEFAILARKRAYVVNVSRGGVIDHEALVAALKGGKLRGAALDVTEPEPLPRESELWDMKNVIITPHFSGGGSEYLERVMHLFDVNLGRLEDGRKMFNIVKRGGEFDVT